MGSKIHLSSSLLLLLYMNYYIYYYYYNKISSIHNGLEAKYECGESENSLPLPTFLYYTYIFKLAKDCVNIAKHNHPSYNTNTHTTCHRMFTSTSFSWFCV